MIVLLYEYPKNHWMVRSKWVTCMGMWITSQQSCYYPQNQQMSSFNTPGSNKQLVPPPFTAKCRPERPRHSLLSAEVEMCQDTGLLRQIGESKPPFLVNALKTNQTNKKWPRETYEEEGWRSNELSLRNLLRPVVQRPFSQHKSQRQMAPDLLLKITTVEKSGALA